MIDPILFTLLAVSLILWVGGAVTGQIWMFRGLWYSVLVTTTLIGIPVLVKVVPEIVRGM